MLNVLILVDLSLVKMFVKVRRVVIFVRNPNADVFRHRIGLTSGIWPRRGRAIPGLHFESVSACSLSGKIMKDDM